MTKYTTNESIWQRLQSPLDIAIERIRLDVSANLMSSDELWVSSYIHVCTYGANWCFGSPTITLLLHCTCINVLFATHFQTLKSIYDALQVNESSESIQKCATAHAVRLQLARGFFALGAFKSTKDTLKTQFYSSAKHGLKMLQRTELPHNDAAIVRTLYRRPA